MADCLRLTFVCTFQSGTIVTHRTAPVWPTFSRTLVLREVISEPIMPAVKVLVLLWNYLLPLLQLLDLFRLQGRNASVL